MMVTMSAVWDRTAAFLTDRLGAVSAVAALTIFIPDAIDGILRPLGDTAAPDLQLGLALLSLGLTLVSVWGQGALMALALDPALGSNEAFARGWWRLGPMIGIGLLLLLALLLLALPPLGLMAVDGVDIGAMADGVAPNMSPGTALAIVLYGLILLPVLLWLGARLMPVSAVIVAERRGVGAISRGFSLTHGLALRLIGVVILFLVVTVVTVMAAKTVVGSIARIALGDHGPLDAASIITTLVVAMVTTAMNAVALAFVAKLYQACVTRAEAVPAA